MICTIQGGAVDFIFGAGQSLFEVIIITNGIAYFLLADDDYA